MGKYLLANNGKFSGTADNITYQRNGIFRNWVSPVNTSSSYKQFILDAITNYSQLWKTLSQDDMDSWYLHNSESLDVFKEPDTIEGINLFISRNINAAVMLQDNSRIHLYQPVIVINNIVPFIINSITITNTSYLIDIRAITGLVNIQIYSSPNLSFGVNKPRRCDFKLVSIQNVLTSTFDIYSDWNTRYSTSPNAGDKIYTRIIAVNSTSYIKSPPFQISSLVS